MQPISRRHLLRSAAAALGAGALARLGVRPVFAADGEGAVIGRSQGGQALTVYRYGNGPMKLFIMGAQHGGPEANTNELARMLMASLAETQGQIPANVSVWVMPEGNPDGLANGVRQFNSGVDPNRNWGTPDWQADAYDSNGRFTPGLGGTAPFSEPETNALANWLWTVWPHYTINYHSVGGFMFGGGSGLEGELSDLYSQASGYPRPTGGGGGGSPLSYRATGNMNGWVRSVGMGGCLIELASVRDPEFKRNQAGVQAVLNRLGQG